MELDSTALEHLVWGNKAAGGFYGFSKGHKPDGKTKKPTACHLMPHTNIWANRGAIVNFVITKIFNPCTHWMVTIQPSILYVQWINVYSYLLTVFCFCPSVLFDSHLILFCFVQLALLDYSVFDYLFTKCYFLSWYWNFIPGISIPISTTIRQINKHHTSDSAIFCLIIESESLLPS